MNLTSQTRREALESVGFKNETIVLDAIKRAGRPVGASELAEELAWPITSIRPRLTALRDLRMIVEAGKRKLPSGRHEVTFSAFTFDGDGQGRLFGGEGH